MFPGFKRANTETEKDQFLVLYSRLGGEAITGLRDHKTTGPLDHETTGDRRRTSSKQKRKAETSKSKAKMLAR
jgi:hypothetical protein